MQNAHTFCGMTTVVIIVTITRTHAHTRLNSMLKYMYELVTIYVMRAHDRGIVMLLTLSSP